MTTEYRVTLDREACDGVFACLVRDDRFAEAADGLATIDGAAADDGAEDVPADRGTGDGGGAPADRGPAAGADGELAAAFDDERLDDARRAARACPLDAIDVSVAEDSDE